MTILLVGLFIFPNTASADQVHRVSPGESLFVIAQKYDVPTGEILNNNKYLRNHNNIFPNQVLIIPEKQLPGTYKVQQGDSLFKIAQKLGISVESIASENQLKNANNLYEGQTLRVPANNGSNVDSNGSNNSYTVKAGDTLFKISESLRVPMESIAKENKLTNWNNLSVGQVLKIPTNITPAESSIYEVKSGDTLSKISQNFGVSIKDLAGENNIENVNELFVGQVLNIPKKDTSFQQSISQLARLNPDTLYLKAPGVGQKIALTFDDGPNPKYTTQLLEVLKKQNVTATFFVMGDRVEKNMSIAKRIVQEGHVIANHTWIHPNLKNVSSARLISEMNRTEDIIERATGKKTALMRPPYGSISQQSIDDLNALDYKIINWSIDSVDWRDQEVDTILTNTLKTIKGNDIILFHDSGGEGQTRVGTIEAMEEIILTLKSQGYEFVTVDNLLGVKAYR